MENNLPFAETGGDLSKLDDTEGHESAVVLLPVAG